MGRGLLIKAATVTLLSLAVTPIATSVASGITSSNNKITPPHKSINLIR